MSFPTATPPTTLAPLPNSVGILNYKKSLMTALHLECGGNLSQNVNELFPNKKIKTYIIY